MFSLCRIVLSLVGLLVTSATVHEAWRMYFGIDFDSKTDGPFVNSLHCFSALSNGRKILSMKQSTSNDNFGCIHGLRFFSTCWVVIGHTWILGAYRSMNPRAVKTVSPDAALCVNRFHYDMIQNIFEGRLHMGNAKPR